MVKIIGMSIHSFSVFVKASEMPLPLFQALNDQLEAQCSDLSLALCSLTEEKAQLQASLKVTLIMVIIL